MRNSDGVEDSELARLAAGGDEAAFGVLLERYAPGARRVARALLGNSDDADDATQEGMLAAWRAIGRFHADRPFRPWLYRIVVNAARDLARRRAVRHADPVPGDYPSRVPGPEQDTERALLRERIRKALSLLPERQRLVVALFDGEGMSHAEIADLVGAREGTIRSEVFHGRRALREHLASYREELR